MSTLSDHRIIIASLFLPTSTAAAFHPEPPTPAANTDDTSALSTAEAPIPKVGSTSSVAPAQKSPTAAKFAIPRPGLSRHATSMSMSLSGTTAASIIDDLLASQSSRTIPTTGTTTATTPNRELDNPFASFAASGQKLIGRDEPNGTLTPPTRSTSKNRDVERGRSPDTRAIDEEDKALGLGGPMYRRLSRKQSKAHIYLA